jgi:hypothetical protein
MANPDSLGMRHLIVCDDVIHNPAAPGRSYSLKNLVNWMRPEDDYGYPLTVEGIMVYSQVWGDKGDYPIWVAIVRLAGDVGEVEDEQVGYYGPWSLTIFENEFVETVYWQMHQITFPMPGVYEIRVMMENGSELGSVRIALKEK